jgi:hypothetical protein
VRAAPFALLKYQPTMNTNLIPKRDAGCVEEVLESEIVLYCSCSEKALYLNESAALVWQLIDGERSIGQIGLLLTDAYPDAVTLTHDLSEAIEMLRKHGVIHL